MGFLGRWLSDAIRLGLALSLTLAAMQVPAIAQGYATALLQIAQESRRDIEHRKAVARQFYAIPAEDDEGVIAALRRVEPANAESLGNSIRRAAGLRAAYDRIEAASPLLRPVVALADAMDDEVDKHAILRTALAEHVPQVSLSLAGGVYGLAGLLLGTLLAQMVIAPFAGRAAARRAAWR
ncbi:DUF2937 family protein [Roseomonas sp. NAR14]|uniref:DUF2937 family protein n=1 Tax=Roseomonas acroporae TaxID=2937791 RepID=A0A9X1Y4M3_9PROT|nr:DUF2937 family protein [Roseomonas acroporae]MCK8783441.1 DUF2937 family protein [Roseomonas acroporae]